jgi:hypothetical protein
MKQKLTTKQIYFAQFLFDQLITDAHVDQWNHIAENLMANLTDPNNIVRDDVMYIRHGYLVSINLLAAAKSRLRTMI